MTSLDHLNILSVAEEKKSSKIVSTFFSSREAAWSLSVSLPLSFLIFCSVPSANLLKPLTHHLLGLYTPPTYIVSFSEAHGLSPARANATLAALNAASALGRLLPAYLADRAGNFNLLAPAAALCGVACLVVAGCLRGLSECLCAVAGVDMVARMDAAASACAPSPGLTSIMAFAVLYGFFSGAGQSSARCTRICTG